MTLSSMAGIVNLPDWEMASSENLESEGLKKEPLVLANCRGVMGWESGHLLNC